MEFVTYYFVYLRSKPWDGPKETFIEHQNYLRWLDNEGFLLLPGPLSDGAGGILFLNCDSLDKAKELANNDPYVKAGKFEVEVHPMAMPASRDMKKLQQCVGLKRFTWNWGLAQRQERYKTKKKAERYTNAVEQHREINQLKQTEFTWMYNYSKCIPQEALRDLERAYINFFKENRERKKKQQKRQYVGERHFRFPRFKKKHRSKDSFRLTGSI